MQEARQERIDAVTKGLGISLTAEEFSKLAGKTFLEKLNTLQIRFENIAYGVEQGNKKNKGQL